MEESKKRKPQFNIPMRESVRVLVKAYCDLWKLKPTEFLSIAIHTFSRMHENPRDILKNVIDGQPMQGQLMTELLSVLRKSNRWQKRLLALHGEFEEETTTKEEVQSSDCATHSDQEDHTVRSDHSSGEEIESILDRLKAGEKILPSEKFALIRAGHCPLCGGILREHQNTRTGGLFVSCNSRSSSGVWCTFTITGSMEDYGIARASIES